MSEPTMEQVKEFMLELKGRHQQKQAAVAARDVLGDAIGRLARLVPGKPTPEAQRRADLSVENEVARLRGVWGAPERHAQTVVTDFSGPWGEAFHKLRSRLGSGFTAALVGTRGTGKTQLAVELMRVVTGKQRSALFLTTVGFLQRVKATYRSDAPKTEADVLKELRRPRLLVLDEFAARGASEWEFNQLFELLNWRYNDRTDTLLIANLKPADFARLAGDSLVSRINEGGGMVDCQWESFRR